MNVKPIFIFLIIFSSVNFLCYYFLPYVVVEFYTIDEVNLLLWNNYGANENVLLLGGYVLTPLYFVSRLSLLTYQNWSRQFFALTLLFIIVLSPFYGFAVFSAIDGFLASIDMLISGVILAMIYTSDLRKEFETAESTNE